MKIHKLEFYKDGVLVAVSPKLISMDKISEDMVKVIKLCTGLEVRQYVAKPKQTDVNIDEIFEAFKPLEEFDKNFSKIFDGIFRTPKK